MEGKPQTLLDQNIERYVLEVVNRHGASKACRPGRQSVYSSR